MGQFFPPPHSNLVYLFIYFALQTVLWEKDVQISLRLQQSRHTFFSKPQMLKFHCYAGLYIFSSSYNFSEMSGGVINSYLKASGGINEQLFQFCGRLATTGSPLQQQSVLDGVSGTYE